MDRVLTERRGNRLGVAAWLVATATVMACGGKQLNVGDDKAMPAGGTFASGGAASAEPAGHGAAASGATGGQTLSAADLAQIQWPPDAECMPAAGSKFMGSWKGHWPVMTDGVDADAVLTISGLTKDGVPCGTLTIGQGAQPPPVTDPDAPYPPSLGAAGGPGVFFPTSPAIATVWPGYAYRMLRVVATDSRLAFYITYGEILRPWCQQQPAYPDSYSCLPEWTTARGGPDGCTIAGPNLPSMSVPCYRMQFCNIQSCFCYQGSCDASVGGATNRFELHWDGAALEGSVNETTLIFLDPVKP